MSHALYQLGQANRLGNRSSNQDRLGYEDGPAGVLLVLADGMGGLEGGELAAETFVDLALGRFRRTSRIGDPAAFFRQVVEESHGAIHDMALEQQYGRSPGTTGVLCLIRDGTACWAHVGDSRLYLFRNGLPLYRTRDHSYVEKLYRRGSIKFGQKSNHPMRNQITQCIGCLEQQPRVDVARPVRLEPGDVLLLCSDGLWNGLDEARMGPLLQRPDLEDVAIQMAEEAEHNSYPQADNISVLTFRYQGCSEPAPSEDSAAAEVREMLRRRKDEPEKLQSAIEQIEQVIRKYRQEMDE